MRVASYMSAAVFMVSLTALLPGIASAADPFPKVDVITTDKTVMGEPITYPTGPGKITMSLVTIAPDHISKFHHHGVQVIGYVLEGSLTIEYQGGERKVFNAGDPIIETMAVPHHGINLSKDKPARLLVTFLGTEGVPNIINDPELDAPQK